MKKYLLVFSIFLFISCKKEIKIISKTNNIVVYEIEPNDPNKNVYGNWVGLFVPKYNAKGDDYSSANKINIVIQKIKGGIANGYSIVAGNMRSWKGDVKTISNGNLQFDVKELGDDKTMEHLIFWFKKIV